jgi:hypothetical protein
MPLDAEKNKQIAGTEIVHYFQEKEILEMKELDDDATLLYCETTKLQLMMRMRESFVLRRV